MARKYYFIFETLIGMAILLAIDIAFLKNSSVYQNIHPHPYWIVILLIACRYGTVQGALAGGLTAIVYIAISAKTGEINFSHDVFPRGVFKYPFLFILVGGILGEIRSIYKKKYLKLEKKHNELQGDLQNLELLHWALTDSKKELEKRIAYQSGTMLNLLERLNTMETLELDRLYPQCLELLEEHLNVTCSSIYLIKNNSLKLFTRRGKIEQSKLPAEIELTHGMMGEVVTNKKAITINQTNFDDQMAKFQKLDLMMCAPIKRKDGAVLGVINVERIPFFDFTTNSVQIFETFCHWISNIVDKAVQFNHLKDRNIADEITGAYNHLYFQKRLSYEVARAKRFNTSLTLVLLQVSKFIEMDDGERKNVRVVLNGIFKNVLRQTDIIAKYNSDDTFAIILPCQASVNVEKMMARLMVKIIERQFNPFQGSDEVLKVKYAMSSLQPSEGSYESLIQTAEERLNFSSQRRAADIFADIGYLFGSNSCGLEKKSKERFVKYK